jgi:hypothetical protein
MEIFVGTFVFVFVAIVVGGNRALKALAAHKAKREADRLNRIASRANRVDYRGPTYNAHGRETN